MNICFPRSTTKAEKDQILLYLKEKKRGFYYKAFKSPDRLFKKSLTFQFPDIEQIWNKIFSEVDPNLQPEAKLILTPSEEKLSFWRFNYARRKFHNNIRSPNLNRHKILEALKWGKVMKEYRDLLIVANLGLVTAMMQRCGFKTGIYKNYSHEIISDAICALIKSVSAFDVGRGFKFSTYGCRAIIKSLYKSRKIIHARNAREVLSDIAFAKIGFNSDEHVIDDDDEKRYLNKVLNNNIHKLLPNERKLLNFRFLESKKLSDIGKELGITAEAVRQMQTRIIRKLRFIITNSASEIRL